eukprot:m.26335 g.26335  ORF g.26335 m.26335 type:complete len:265 (-) comp8816_c2_seq1:313-1107(-)
MPPPRGPTAQVQSRKAADENNLDLTKPQTIHATVEAAGTTKKRQLPRQLSAISASLHQGSHQRAQHPLPNGWEVVYTPTGKPCFVNHTLRTTSWTDPRTKTVADDELPFGWEQAFDSTGREYFIDHIHKRTQREHPELTPVKRPPFTSSRHHTSSSFHKSEHIALQMLEASEQTRSPASSPHPECIKEDVEDEDDEEDKVRVTRTRSLSSLVSRDSMQSIVSTISSLTQHVSLTSARALLERSFGARRTEALEDGYNNSSDMHV